MKHRIQIPFLTLLVVAVTGLTMSACDSTKPDEGDGAGEQELITRVVISFSEGSNTITATANDPDGDGTNFDLGTIILESGKTYSGSISVYDDINGDDVGAEIEKESDVHQFFFNPGGGAAGRLTLTPVDEDVNQLPVGLEFSADVSDGGPTTGTLRVILSHYDSDVKDGTTLSNDTDIDITYPVEIQ